MEVEHQYRRSLDLEIDYYIKNVPNFDVFCRDTKSFISFEDNPCLWACDEQLTVTFKTIDFFLF